MCVGGEIIKGKDSISRRRNISKSKNAGIRALSSKYAIIVRYLTYRSKFETNIYAFSLKNSLGVKYLNTWDLLAMKVNEHFSAGGVCFVLFM